MPKTTFTGNLALKLAIVASRRRQLTIARQAGLSDARLSYLVTGRAHPTPKEKARLAFVLRKSEAELFGVDQETVA